MTVEELLNKYVDDTKICICDIFSDPISKPLDAKESVILYGHYKVAKWEVVYDVVTYRLKIIVVL